MPTGDGQDAFDLFVLLRMWRDGAIQPLGPIALVLNKESSLQVEGSDKKAF